MKNHAYFVIPHVLSRYPREVLVVLLSDLVVICVEETPSSPAFVDAYCLCYVFEIILTRNSVAVLRESDVVLGMSLVSEAYDWTISFNKRVYLLKVRLTIHWHRGCIDPCTYILLMRFKSVTTRCCILTIGQE